MTQITPEIRESIVQRIDLGYSKEKIVAEFVSLGYEEGQAEEFVDLVQTDTSRVSVPKPPTPTPTPTPPSMDTQAEESPSPVTGAKADNVLVSVPAMLAQGLRVSFSEWKTFLYFAAFTIISVILVGVIFALLAFSLSLSLPEEYLGIAAALLMIFALVFLVTVVSAGLVRALLFRDTDQSCFQHVRWAVSNFWSSFTTLSSQQLILLNPLYLVAAPLILVTYSSTTISIYSVSGALILLSLNLIFILLSFALTSYVAWSLYMFVSDKGKGAKAVTASIFLIKGRFWSVALRTFCLGVLIVLVQLGGEILGEALGLRLDEYIAFVGFVSLLFIPILIGCTVVLFESLLKTSQAVSVEQESKMTVWVRIGVVSGLVAIGLFVLAVGAFAMMLFSLF